MPGVRRSFALPDAPCLVRDDSSLPPPSSLLPLPGFPSLQLNPFIYENPGSPCDCAYLLGRVLRVKILASIANLAGKSCDRPHKNYEVTCRDASKTRPTFQLETNSGGGSVCTSQM